MKKIVLLLISLLLLQNASFPENVSFLYINGSNSNSEKSKKWFYDGVNKLHPKLTEQFEEKVFPLFPEYEFHINETPVIFFWGDKSKNDLEFVSNQLDISKALSPTIAFKIRSMLTDYLHDAIWVQKSHHMLSVLEGLHEKVMAEHAKGNKVILYGYSAGTFITYEYLVNRLPYINTKDLFNSVNIADETKKYISENPTNNTCLAALSSAHIGVVSSSGNLLTDVNDQSLRKNYLHLDEATAAACIPQDSVKGIINFASPLVLFYSDVADPQYEQTYYNKLMLKYILENGLFWLTVNFKEDPLGYPTSINLTNDELNQITDINLQHPTGFIYDNSSVWSKRLCLFAHTSYWSAAKTFSKAVAKSFVEGYKFQYDPEVQEKILKKRQKLNYEL